MDFTTRIADSGHGGHAWTYTHNPLFLQISFNANKLSVSTFNESLVAYINKTLTVASPYYSPVQASTVFVHYSTHKVHIKYTHNTCTKQNSNIQAVQYLQYIRCTRHTVVRSFCSVQ